MVLRFEFRPDLPPLEEAQVVLVMSNVYNGKFVRSGVCNGKPVFNRQRCDRGGWQLSFRRGCWQLGTTHSAPFAPSPGVDVRTWDNEKKLWIFNKGGESEHEMNTSIEVLEWADGTVASVASTASAAVSADDAYHLRRAYHMMK